MSILCALFGHKSMEGIYSGGEYCTVRPTSIDGIGREHAELHGRCPRCGTEHVVGRIHRPLAWFDGKTGRERK